MTNFLLGIPPGVALGLFIALVCRICRERRDEAWSDDS